MIDVKKLAEQASDKDKVPAFQNDFWTLTQSELEAFAALVLEAAAVECDEVRHPWGYSSDTPDWLRGTDQCAEVIRAMKGMP